MARQIRITAGEVSATALLNDSPTADLIWEACPIRAKAQTWGDEIYFETPVETEGEDLQPTVGMGDLAYWPPGQAFCIFFGPTRAKEVLAEGTADRDQTISEIGAIMEIALTNIQVVTGDPGILRLWTGGKPADLLLTTLASHACTTATILNTAMVYPRPVGGKKGAETWRDIVQNMLRVAEKVDAGAEATAEGSFISMLQLFAERRTAVTVPPGELPDDGNNPFRREGRIWFRLKDLMEVLQRAGAKLTQREVVQRLTVLGAERKTHKIRTIDDTTTTRRFYGVEESKIEGED